MNSENILNDVNRIFIDVLDNDQIKLTRLTTAKDVEDWDSLNHIQLIVAIEKHFKVRFTTAQIRSWANVGEMCDALGSATTIKIGGKS
jgi:acyl carrier protein